MSRSYYMMAHILFRWVLSHSDMSSLEHIEVALERYWPGLNKIIILTIALQSDHYVDYTRPMSDSHLQPFVRNNAFPLFYIIDDAFINKLCSIAGGKRELMFLIDYCHNSSSMQSSQRLLTDESI